MCAGVRTSVTRFQINQVGNLLVGDLLEDGAVAPICGSVHRAGTASCWELADIMHNAPPNRRVID
jgi:hypothetical protein